MKAVLLKILKILGNSLLVVIKIALAAAVFIAGWYYLTPYFRVERNVEGDYFRNLPANTIDVVALGSSHMQYAFNPAVFYAETGYYSYVLGSSCQPMTMTYSLLQECLKTQKPSLAVIDVFTMLPQSETCYADGMYYKAMDEMTGETRFKAADGVPENVRNEYRFDLLMNHDNWKTITLDRIEEQIRSVDPAQGYNYDFGYVPMLPENPRYAPLVTYSVTEKVELTDSEKEQLQNIIDLCRDNGMNVLFIKTPYIIDQECTNKLAAIWRYLDEQDVPYRDYIALADELDWFVDMDGDTWHNNAWGAEIVTGDLASLTKKNGYVKEHKDNETVQTLMDGMLTNTAYLLMNEQNVNVYRLLDEAQKYPSVLLCRYTPGAWTTLSETENRLLNSAGLHHDFINDFDQAYYAAVVDGVTVKESEEPIKVTINGKKVVIDEKGITIDGVSCGESGEMELVFAADDLSWVNDIPIDYVSRWFWKNGCDGFDCSE